jgi:hypothetical protein
MNRPFRIAAALSCLAALGSPLLPAAASLSLGFREGATNLVLNSRDARQQLLATDDAGHDATHAVRWTSRPAGIVHVDAEGRVSPVADGIAHVSAQAADGSSAELPVRVVGSAESAPLHFANQIVPIFTKNGCNGGGCHGKAAGQNGFRLSLLGFEPDEDYEHLVRVARGRRRKHRERAVGRGGGRRGGQQPRRWRCVFVAHSGGFARPVSTARNWCLQRCVAPGWLDACRQRFQRVRPGPSGRW